MRFARTLRGPTRMPISFMSSEVNSTKASPSTFWRYNVSATPVFFGNTACAQSRTCKQHRLEAQARDIEKRLIHSKLLDLLSCLLQPVLRPWAQPKQCSSLRAFTDSPPDTSLPWPAGAGQSYQAQTGKNTSSLNVPLSLRVLRPRRRPDKLKLQ